MASVVIAGDTSGTVTLAAPAVAGTTTLTLPTANGTILTTGSSGQSIPKAALPTGSVLQVVSTTKTDTASTTSQSWSDISGLSVSITPTSSTSRILVLLNVTGGNNNGGGAVKLLRNSTDIAIGTAATGNQVNSSFANYFDNGDNNSLRGYGLTHLDSPATTSAITYKAQFRMGTVSGGWIFYVNRAVGNDDQPYVFRTVSTITVMEIAA